MATCTELVQVKNGTLVRFAPPQPGTNGCSGKVYDTKTKKISEGFPE